MIGRTSWLPHPPTKHPPDKSQLLHIVPAPAISLQVRPKDLKRLLRMHILCRCPMYEKRDGRLEDNLFQFM